MPRYFQIPSIIPASIQRRLQDHGQIGKNGMAKNGAKAFFTYQPEADMLMPIQMRAHGASAIVEMNELKSLQPNAIIELIQRCLQS